MMDVSIIVPFHNPHNEEFSKCIEHLKELNVAEVILVDDGSTDEQSTAIAKKSDFRYERSLCYSNNDGFAYNQGVKLAKSHYVCKVDPHDCLLEVPSSMTHDFHLAKSEEVSHASTFIQKPITPFKDIFNGAIIPTELMRSMPFEESADYFNDTLSILRLIYRNHSFSMHGHVNYVPSKEVSKESSYVAYAELQEMKTLARFAQLENIPLSQVEHYLRLASLNLRHALKRTSTNVSAQASLVC